MSSFGKTVREEKVVSINRESNGNMRSLDEKESETIPNLPFVGIKEVESIGGEL